MGKYREQDQLQVEPCMSVMMKKSPRVIWADEEIMHEDVSVSLTVEHENPFVLTSLCLTWVFQQKTLLGRSILQWMSQRTP